MKKHINETIPNSSTSQDWVNYINRNKIELSTDKAILKYQGNDNGSGCKADDINHYLNLLSLNGNLLDEYTALAQDFSNCDISDFHEEKSLVNAIDKLFEDRSYSFNKDSRLFKGISDCSYIYKRYDLRSLKVGDKVVFTGYFSTSANKNIAQSHKGHEGLILTIIDLCNATSLIPEPTAILTTPTKTPEDEILLNRNLEMEISTIQGNEIKLSVL